MIIVSLKSKIHIVVKAYVTALAHTRSSSSETSVLPRRCGWISSYNCTQLTIPLLVDRFTPQRSDRKCLNSLLCKPSIDAILSTCMPFTWLEIWLLARSKYYILKLTICKASIKLLVFPSEDSNPWALSSTGFAQQTCIFQGLRRNFRRKRIFANLSVPGAHGRLLCCCDLFRPFFFSRSIRWLRSYYSLSQFLVNDGFFVS